MTQLVDVAIGLFLLYVVLSLTVTSATEMFNQIASTRWRKLRERIEGMLGSTWAGKLLEHGAVLGLGKKPSGIPSWTFRAALIHNIEDEAAKAGKSVNDFLTAAAAGTDVLAKPAQALLAFMHETGGSLRKAEKRIEDWFDDSMERCIGNYKRYSRYISFVLGFALAVIINADTFTITSRLWNDSLLRATLVAAGTDVVADAIYSDEEATPADDVTDAESAEETEEAEPKSAEKLRMVLDNISEQVSKSKVQLPLGWSVSQLKSPFTVWDGLFKFFGWLVTALAISLGAPFWFDLLGKLVSLKGSGKMPATAVAKRKEEEEA